MNATEVLNTYWNGDLPVPLISIANAMGLRVFKQQNLDCSGKIFLDENGNARIVFNSDEATVRQRFTIAHEIGHFSLGHLKPGHTAYRDDAAHFSSNVRDPEEIAANKFAARLLMPADSIKTAFLKMGKLSVEDMAEMFNVSTVAMRYRLINLGLIRG